MTKQIGHKTLMPFINRAEADNDPYFIVHFSRESDYYQGYDNGLDAGDALIIIERLIRQHKINLNALSFMTAGDR